MLEEITPAGNHSVGGDSIQEILEAVIERITQEKVNVIGSGRTDAGVNARAQVIHV